MVMICSLRPTLAEVLRVVEQVMRDSPGSAGVFPGDSLSAKGRNKLSNAGVVGKGSMLDEFMACKVDFARHVPVDFECDAGILGFIYVYKNQRVLSCFASSSSLINMQSMKLNDHDVLHPMPAQYVGLSSETIAYRKALLLQFFEFASPQLQKQFQCKGISCVDTFSHQNVQVQDSQTYMPSNDLKNSSTKIVFPSDIFTKHVEDTVFVDAYMRSSEAGFYAMRVQDDTCNFSIANSDSTTYLYQNVDGSTSQSHVCSSTLYIMYSNEVPFEAYKLMSTQLAKQLHSFKFC
jgi:hypothetical protein